MSEYPTACLIAAARLLDKLGVAPGAGEVPVRIAADALQSYAGAACSDGQPNGTCGDVHGSGDVCNRPTNHPGWHHVDGSGGLGWED